MSGMKVGYTRVSTNEQDLTAQRNALAALGVDEKHIFVDHGLTGTNRACPGLREAMAAVRAGDTLVVTKLDRLVRSLLDAREWSSPRRKVVSAGSSPSSLRRNGSNLLSLHDVGAHTQAELAVLFSVSRTTVYTGRSSAAARRRSQLTGPDAGHAGVAWAQVVQ